MRSRDGSKIEVFSDPGVGTQVGINVHRSEANQAMWRGKDFVALDLTVEQAEQLIRSLEKTVKSLGQKLRCA